MTTINDLVNNPEFQAYSAVVKKRGEISHNNEKENSSFSSFRCSLLIGGLLAAASIPYYERASTVELVIGGVTASLLAIASLYQLCSMVGYMRVGSRLQSELEHLQADPNYQSIERALGGALTSERTD